MTALHVFVSLGHDGSKQMPTHLHLPGFAVRKNIKQRKGFDSVDFGRKRGHVVFANWWVSGHSRIKDCLKVVQNEGCPHGLAWCGKCSRTSGEYLHAI
jgi:hypothetical protein